MHQLTSKIVPALDLTDTEIREWKRLWNGDMELESPFYSPQFTLAVAQCRADVQVCVIRRADRIVGFFPFQFASLWHKMLGAGEPAGTPFNDHFGLAGEPDLRLEQQDILRLASLRSFFYDYMEEKQQRYGLPVDQARPGLRIRIGEAAGEYWQELKARKKSLAQQTERHERQVVKTFGELKFSFRQTEWSGPLQQLIEQKSEQYVRTGKGDLFANPRHRKLMTTLASLSDPECSGVLSTLYAGDTWVASHFGLRGGGMLHIMFPVYNQELSKYSPGRLLLKLMIEASPECGVHTIDCGEGEARYKVEFGNDRHNFYKGWWSSPGLRSFAYRGYCSLKWRAAAVREAKLSAATVSGESL